MHVLAAWRKKIGRLRPADFIAQLAPSLKDVSSGRVK